MTSLQNIIVDKAIDSAVNNINPAAIIPKSMISFVDNEKINLNQLASNFLGRYFEFRTKDHEKKINVVQLMSEYNGNFSTPVCYLQFYLKRAGKFIRFAEDIGALNGKEEIHRLNCIRIYKDFIQRYSDLIGAIQLHETACDGRLFRRSIERMKPEIAHVPMNLHLQQLLVSSGDDPSQKSIYNTVTLGAPAVHHSRFVHGGLSRMKANIIETNKRLCYLQDALQDALILNSDIDDALDHLTRIIENPSTQIDSSVLKLSLQRVVKAVFSLLEYSSKDLDSISNSSVQVVFNPFISKVSSNAISTSNNTINDKAKKLLEEIKESMNKDEQTFKMPQLNNLKSIADELERHTCENIMRYIFQESMEIERYSQNFRERFDIAFSQAANMIPVLHSIDCLLNRFDDLSQRHASFVSNFDTNFTDIENPLRDVARDKEEQQKTIENLVLASMENNDQIGSFSTVEDFNRRITKSRCNNRPPSYSSNDSSSFFHHDPSRSSWATTESAPPPRTSTSGIIRTVLKASSSQPIALTSMNNLVEPNIRLTHKIKPKILPQNPPTTRRHARSAITTFTIETVNRLSKPKTYHQSPDQKISQKRIHRRSKPYQHIKKETPESSVTLSSSSPSPTIKRTIPTTIKSSPKKLKPDNRFSTNNAKRIPTSNYSRPTTSFAPPPTICLTFPMQPELKLSHFVVVPKATTNKTINILTNKRTIIPTNRRIQLMT